MFDGRVELAVKLARKYFHIRRVLVEPTRIEMEVEPKYPGAIDKDYEMLRYAYKMEGMIPILTKRKKSYFLVVYKKLKRRTMPLWVNVVFLVLAVLSTMYVGGQYYANYYDGVSPGTLDAYLGGLITFTLPLFAILGSHEMAHYIASRKHNVDASLPFFIPAPNIIGTFGALISVREPIPDRKALLDIGASGPIAGFLVAIVIAFLVGGYPPRPVEGEIVTAVNFPFIYDVLSLFFPTEWGVYLSSLHPAQVAVWVGFVVTAMNLFPVGQLDGGHIARAIFGEHSMYINYLFVGVMVVLSLMYPGWLIFLLIIVLLGGGITHSPPLNEVSTLDAKRVAVGILSFAILVVSFTPVPIYIEERPLDYSLSVQMDTSIMMEGVFESVNITVMFRNTGEVSENVSLRVISALPVTANATYFTVEPGETYIWNTTLMYSPNTISGKYTIVVVPTVNGRKAAGVDKSVLLLRPDEDLVVTPSSVADGENVTIRNVGNRTINFTVVSSTNVSYVLSVVHISGGYVVGGNVTGDFGLGPGGKVVIRIEGLSGGRYLLFVVTEDYRGAYFEVVV